MDFYVFRPEQHQNLPEILPVRFRFQIRNSQKYIINSYEKPYAAPVFRKKLHITNIE